MFYKRLFEENKHIYFNPLQKIWLLLAKRRRRSWKKNTHSPRNGNSSWVKWEKIDYVCKNQTHTHTHIRRIQTSKLVFFFLRLLVFHFGFTVCAFRFLCVCVCAKMYFCDASICSYTYNISSRSRTRFSVFSIYLFSWVFMMTILCRRAAFSHTYIFTLLPFGMVGYV